MGKKYVGTKSSDKTGIYICFEIQLYVDFVFFFVFYVSYMIYNIQRTTHYIVLCLPSD